MQAPRLSPTAGSCLDNLVSGDHALGEGWWPGTPSCEKGSGAPLPLPEAGHGPAKPKQPPKKHNFSCAHPEQRRAGSFCELLAPSDLVFQGSFYAYLSINYLCITSQ